MQELWKDIKGYENIYQISSLGNVKSCNYNRTGIARILKPIITKGYLCVGLNIKGQQKKYKIHKLVAEAFIPNPDNKLQINHKNGLKTDNRVENLEWSTAKENLRHALDTGLRTNSTEKQKQSARNKGIKQRKNILQYNNNFSKEWDGIKQASRATGINASNISKCCRGKLKSTGGYMWKYL